MTKIEEKIVKWEQIKSTFEFAKDISRLNKNESTLAKGMMEILSAIVDDLKSLNKQPEAITGGSHFCKHDVGGSTANEESTSLVTDASDTPSETQAVGGNKQTREVCRCEDPKWDNDQKYCYWCNKPTGW